MPCVVLPNRRPHWSTLKRRRSTTTWRWAACGRGRCTVAATSRRVVWVRRRGIVIHDAHLERLPVLRAERRLRPIDERADVLHPESQRFGLGPEADFRVGLDDRVFVLSRDEALLAFDARDGAQRLLRRSLAQLHAALGV